VTLVSRSIDHEISWEGLVRSSLKQIPHTPPRNGVDLFVFHTDEALVALLAEEVYMAFLLA
jgi:hypothetical protein